MDRYDIGDLLTKVPLEDVVKRLGIETERRGVQTRALCPFHQDTRPSLNLYPVDGSSQAHYHCFACGAHGNAIDLVKQVEGLDFLPAVQWLARQFGIKPLRDKISRRVERNVASETALDFAQRTFNAEHDVERFKNWCDERGFEHEFLFGQGLRCITRGVLVEALQAKSTGERAELIDGLQSIGLIKRLRSHSVTEQGKLELPDQFQDCFHDGRVVIPIRSGDSKRTEVVGFAGRALQGVPPEGVAKYLLTPGFEKAAYLFNEPEAFKAVAEALKNDKPARLYLVEGFLDALRLQSLGQPAVALMGISLGKGQFERLTKLAQDTPGTAPLTYYVFLDNDPAGFSGAVRLVRGLLGLTGVDLCWVGVPWRTEPALGKDPDSCLRGLATPKEAAAWLKRYDLPAEAVLLASALGSQDASELHMPRWGQLAATARERALFRTALAVKKLHGRRSAENVAARLKDSPWDWVKELYAVLAGSEDIKPPSGRGLYLDESSPRAALARTLAYHGSRRGELPCDEEAWQTLSGNERLFDQTAFKRLRTTVAEDHVWRQAAPFDAVHLPRRLTADPKVLDDPRLKVMPHPADLHVQQILINELLTQRHDRLSASGHVFSAGIPAVRWYASRQEVVVTGPFPALNEPDLELGESETLSFGYQIDMDVLEADKTPSDQGMFRPFGQCWRAFMASLAQQCHAIGSRVYVLRLDAKRYYDSIQRYVVRDALLTPLTEALVAHGVPEGFKAMFGLREADSPDWDAALERLLSGLIFHYEYRDPEVEGQTQRSGEVTGIAQGPVLSAYLGTIALFPVDDAARQFMRRTVQTEPDGRRRPRVGYARYVDDIVLFADSEALLKELREVLQAKAAERSIALIHKGERVRAGSPSQVMHQLNEGRGLAASVPAWEPPIIGDGDADWSLGDDMPEVDRQCALQLLRHPALMGSPARIAEQVKAAMAASDLRPNDLGLCARWLWWQVAATGLLPDGDAAWRGFEGLWDEVCGDRPWAEAFKQRGYHWLYAVEGLDKLLDPNPWQANGQILTEREENRAKRVHLAGLVCAPGFFSKVKPVENREHVRRRTRLVARKARRLANGTTKSAHVDAHLNERLTAIQWLCQASQAITVSSDEHPLAALRERQCDRRSGDDLLHAVIEQLTYTDTHPRATTQNSAPSGPNRNDSAIALAIDFILDSAPPRHGLELLSRLFPGLLSDDDGNNRRLIPHLPIISETVTSLYAIDTATSIGGRYLYRYSERDQPASRTASERHFAQVTLRPEPPHAVEVSAQRFVHGESNAARLAVEKSEEPMVWDDLYPPGSQEADEPITHRAVRLFYALLAMHQLAVDDESKDAYVPFRPQLFRQGQGDLSTLHLVAERVPGSLLGASAWYHDQDDRVVSVIVPKARADLWRVGWAVADVLGVAADMSGETGERDEQLGNFGYPHGEQEDAEEFKARAKKELEGYVLRQQLRKLQGTYLSEAQIETVGEKEPELPGTVKRALTLLLSYPSDQDLDVQVRHLLTVEAESRAMVLRLQMRSGADLRDALHRVFPDVLARVPLWALQGLELKRSAGNADSIRPELALMLSLYRAMYPVSASSEVEAKASSLRMALVLATVGIGLRGSVAALWGFSAASGSQRMAEQLNLPKNWAMPDMARLDPQADYQVMRKRLFESDWPELSKASPWQWMLALIGLLDAGFAQALDAQTLGTPALKEVYLALRAWQTESGSTDDAALFDESEQRWPFDTLPRFTLQRCESLMRDLPEALRALDQLRGMRLVCVEAPTFGRSRNTDEFIDASGAGWQMTKPQFTSLYANTVEQRKASLGTRLLKVWTETRRTSDNELLAVHTLDFKLGQWLSSAPVRADDVEVLRTVPAKPVATDDEVVPAAAATADNEVTPQMSLRTDAGEHPKAVEQPAVATNEVPDTVRVDHLSEWQQASWKDRLGTGKSSDDETARNNGHFRVALLQWSVSDSYAHPMAEAGLNGLPLGKSSLDELRIHLESASFKALNKAAKRGMEFHWRDDLKIISWPEHRRRALLGEALKACQHLNVQLLVLPEVSVRPETVAWLKNELRQHPGLAVLAGTYRHFGAKDDPDHLKEQLTLLWQPDKALADAFGLEIPAEAVELQRGKKYRAVAAHELFRPDDSPLAPLYTEARLLEKLRSRMKGDWSSAQLTALIPALIHGPQKLRYCMELVCSELFLLTSPANRKPLQQELAKVLKQLNRDATEAEKQVDDDFKALGELLTVAQSNRERRSVLLVPACTSRSNDYWHAGQASVLASGTATVFCNVADKPSAGGSCFIGIDSVTEQKADLTGIVRLLTPYHGWHKGILQPGGKGALSKTDQALVVVDLDPVHVVSGRPRPQLLPEPMSLVAYLPIVEVVHKDQNANCLANALQDALTVEGRKALHRLLLTDAFPASCGKLHQRDDFDKALKELLSAKESGELKPETGGDALDTFAAFFGDSGAVRERIMAWLKDRHQQPAPKAGKLQLEPAWVDFLVADITWRHSAKDSPAIHVPPWLDN
ncbi:DNA primase, catalytic core [Variovorax sp. YR752]|uniref:CHC2 zinc finger domain-containing protein n=1 Tax=Variovorax sp. YR752 TaxID=1884383 RepID=UPI000BCDC6B0|nr:CHC2 zinc finger domain-containing protein [Variovorax sp. YR752]SOD25642.1 DNA primase, catalytic core [Variovorax sp. YR752]